MVASKALSLAAAPTELLAALRERLREHGVADLTFRSARRDYLLYDFRSLVGLLAQAHEGVAREALAEALTHGFDYSDTRLHEVVNAARDAYHADRETWVEQYLRPAGRPVRLAEVFDSLDTTGLSFLGWVEPALWHVGPRIMDDLVADCVEALPPRLRWEFVDRINAAPYRLYCGRSGDAAPERPWMEDDATLLRCPLHPAEWSVATKAAPSGQLRRPYVLRPSPNEPDHVILETVGRSEYRLHELFAALLQAMDGTRTLGELLTEAAESAGVGLDGLAHKVLPTVRRLIEPHGVLVVGPPEPPPRASGPALSSP